jgi:hypothetical protein
MPGQQSTFLIVIAVKLLQNLFAFHILHLQNKKAQAEKIPACTEDTPIFLKMSITM